ncbi:hypothetical protein [uncultured Duncaniella sp.]|uniref:hypothetical protein n=1 Tax=uncultured Duncaniella sp. TaxID=2768039 RepID=UPI0026775CEA|nr:hypothetical protein [uncultured Duncaniella sp.]MCI9172850.1 hypothetical protein [Muribaculaceae bacterium]
MDKKPNSSSQFSTRSERPMGATGPSRITLERIRQFARVYTCLPGREMPIGIILN